MPQLLHLAYPESVSSGSAPVTMACLLSLVTQNCSGFTDKDPII